jgi:GntR family transcriptional regulator
MPIDLHIATGSTVPIYRQIVDQVCHTVAAGGLSPEDQLPSVRELAEKLVVNPNTVAKAYGELVREGVAESRQGRGVFITRRRQVYSRAERVRRLEAALDGFVNEAVFLDFDAGEIREALDRRLRAVEARARANSERADGRRS